MNDSLLELRKKLLAKLGHLWLNHYAAVRLIRIAFEILLVILLGQIE